MCNDTLIGQRQRWRWRGWVWWDNLSARLSTKYVHTHLRYYIWPVYYVL